MYHTLVPLFWLRMVKDSNLRSTGYEPVKMPLLYPPQQLMVLTDGYDPSLPSPQLSVLPLSLNQGLIGVHGEIRTPVKLDLQSST